MPFAGPRSGAAPGSSTPERPRGSDGRPRSACGAPKSCCRRSQRCYRWPWASTSWSPRSRLVIHSWSAVPYWDQWDELILSPGKVFSPWLYSQHNEHRILFPRLLFAIDTFAFAETNKFNFFCNVALPLTLVGLIVHVARRHVSRGLTDTLWIAGIVLTVLFSAIQYENFVWGFQVQFFGVELAAVASIASLALGRGAWPSLAAAIAFSTIAVYTLASGMVVPFLAIPVALWAGRSKAQVAVLAVAAAVLLALYLHGYVSPSDIPTRCGLCCGRSFRFTRRSSSATRSASYSEGFAPHISCTGIALSARSAWLSSRRRR